MKVLTAFEQIFHFCWNGLINLTDWLPDQSPLSTLYSSFSCPCCLLPIWNSLNVSSSVFFHRSALIGSRPMRISIRNFFFLFTTEWTQCIDHILGWMTTARCKPPHFLKKAFGHLQLYWLSFWKYTEAVKKKTTIWMPTNPGGFCL